MGGSSLERGYHRSSFKAVFPQPYLASCLDLSGIWLLVPPHRYETGSGVRRRDSRLLGSGTVRSRNQGSHFQSIPLPLMSHASSGLILGRWLCLLPAYVVAHVWVSCLPGPPLGRIVLFFFFFFFFFILFFFPLDH